ncbi:MAG: hypothetical protein A2Y62_08510 [Candidatus Fischerbacteria bacterium RBG_13_37_8]|uniref:Uncharacterized protein n=1 Tax=Candidatus Fischerbacteria bacterium RBG_13_37_8 TaxID=1817863 RepID=A0A1F5VYI8_9BACT|nr:MAG: hypothetical protein A2Y62_08510 [Candidatus Fischerbacteria bacterium RBG_13_37_8]
MTKKSGTLKKENVIHYLKGHKYANKIQVIEKSKRLSQMSVDDSLREYNHLCDLWYSTTQSVNMDSLNKRKIISLIERRKKFDQAQSYRRKK